MKYIFKNRCCNPPVPLKGAGAVLGKPGTEDFLTICFAGNEKIPLVFEGEYVKADKAVLPTFDYALADDQENFAIEWKERDDFISSLALSKKWIHELAKITRAREWDLPIIYVVGINFDDIATYDYSIFTSGRVTSQYIYRRVAELVFEYNVHVFFAGSRSGASYAIALLLKRRKEMLKLEGNNQ